MPWRSCWFSSLSHLRSFPIVWTFLISLKPEEDIVTATMSYLPRRVTFENYVAIWTRSNFPTLIAQQRW